MLTMFLAGAFVGAVLGFVLSALLASSTRADVYAQCAACEADYQARLLEHRAGLDWNDHEWWHTAPRVDAQA